MCIRDRACPHKPVVIQHASGHAGVFNTLALERLGVLDGDCGLERDGQGELTGRGEENPFLGFRAIRYCLSRPDLFKTQLSAILRASAYGSIRILLPFVSCVDEVRSARVLLEETKSCLAQEGVPFDKDIPLGVMVETLSLIHI